MSKLEGPLEMRDSLESLKKIGAGLAKKEARTPFEKNV